MIIQKGHDIKETLRSYWSTAEQFCTPFYSNTMKCNSIFHILRFLHFSDNMNQPDEKDRNYDRLWKLRTIFDHSGALVVNFTVRLIMFL